MCFYSRFFLVVVDILIGVYHLGFFMKYKLFLEWESEVLFTILCIAILFVVIQMDWKIHLFLFSAIRNDIHIMSIHTTRSNSSVAKLLKALQFFYNFHFYFINKLIIVIRLKMLYANVRLVNKRLDNACIKKKKKTVISV